MPESAPLKEEASGLDGTLGGTVPALCGEYVHRRHNGLDSATLSSRNFILSSGIAVPPNYDRLHREK